MSMAHWHALQAWDAHYQLADENQHTPLLLPSLAAMMGGGPLALPLDPAVQQTFERLWRGVLQAIPAAGAWAVRKCRRACTRQGPTVSA